MCIVETLPDMRGDPIFFPLEMCVTALFTVEFLLRLFSAESVKSFATNGFNLIDFLAIFPGYIELAALVRLERPCKNTGLSAGRVYLLRSGEKFGQQLRA